MKQQTIDNNKKFATHKKEKEESAKRIEELGTSFFVSLLLFAYIFLEKANADIVAANTKEMKAATSKLERELKSNAEKIEKLTAELQELKEKSEKEINEKKQQLSNQENEKRETAKALESALSTNSTLESSLSSERNSKAKLEGEIEKLQSYIGMFYSRYSFIFLSFCPSFCLSVHLSFLLCLSFLSRRTIETKSE